MEYRWWKWCKEWTVPLPHHGVYHAKKNKIRVVFDVQRDSKELLWTITYSVDITNNLVGVLCRFRRYSYAIICDVEKMFHQFIVRVNDRDYLGFLWWPDGDVKKEPKEYRMKIHLFGATSSPGCASYGLRHGKSRERSTSLSGSVYYARFLRRWRID